MKGKGNEKPTSKMDSKVTSESQPNQKLPSHHDDEGRRDGERSGAVRPTHDAYQGPRDTEAEHDKTPRKPAN